MNKTYLKLLIFYSSYLWFQLFTRAVLPVHFLKQGFSVTEQILSQAILFLVPTILLLSLRGLSAKRAWRISVILAFIYILLSVKIIHPLQFYVAAAVMGGSLYFFWPFYNIAHFENTPKQNIGRSSALMFSIPLLISIIGPLAAGFLAEININLVWFLLAAFFLVTILLVELVKDFHLSYSIKNALSEIKATRVLIFLEGIWEAVVFGIIPIFTLFFIKTTGSYGSFLAYLSLVAVLANLFLGRLTDKLQKRAVFLYPLSIGLALATFIFPFATSNIIAWVIITGLVQSLLPLFWNISTAVVIDTSGNLRQAIPGRELMLASGRTLGLFLVFISLILEKIPFYIFFVLGFIMLLYPINLFWNSRLKKHYKYL